MAKRKLEDLNLLDDFLFGAVVTHPEVGEKFVREILKTIFGKDFGNAYADAAGRAGYDSNFSLESVHCISLLKIKRFHNDNRRHEVRPQPFG